MTIKRMLNVETYETSSQIILCSNMRFIVMFVTAVSVLLPSAVARMANVTKGTISESGTDGRV